MASLNTAFGLLETPTGAEATTRKITLTQKYEVRQVLQGPYTTVQRVTSKEPARCTT